MGGSFLSRREVDVLNRALKGEAISYSESGISKREWRQLCSKFGLDDGGV